jgi:hypothetical protein
VFAESGQDSMLGLWENHKEFSGYIKDGEFFHQLNDYQFLKNNSISWSIEVI